MTTDAHPSLPNEARFGLTARTLTLLEGVFRQFAELERVVLYGSRAKGNYREGSDIDLALFGEQLTPSISNRIIADLEELPTLYSFDVALYTEISNPDLCHHIQRVGQVLYEQ